MEHIIDIIKSYDKYTYDNILDTYSVWNTPDVLYYCTIKKNKMEIPQVMKDINKDYDKTMLFIFNIQRKLDGELPVLNLDEMYKKISDLLNIDTHIDDEDQYDF